MSMPELEASWPATLTTDRLLLRPVEPADVAELSRVWTDPVVRQYLGGPVDPEELLRRQRGCVNNPGLFCVLRPADSAVVGLIVINPDSRHGKTEVSYLLLSEYWGQGYGREAVAAATAWALDTLSTAPLEVVAVTQQANTRSCKLLESIGMTVVDKFVEYDAAQVMYAVSRDTLSRA
jgi:RimJ/RimL family protein N-acetyltransferase